MEIKNDNNNDSQLLRLDDDNESNLLYYNLEDEVRFDLEVAIDDEKNEVKIGSKVYLNSDIEDIIVKLASWR